MTLTEKQENRFWGFVDKSNPCWIWQSYKNEKGYGRFGLNYKHEYAHRVSYFLVNGEIPTDMTIDHLCRNRACVNPDHLEVVTRGENVLRGETVSGKEKRQTHCIKGHEFTPETTRTYRGHRSCRICQKERQKQFRQDNPNYLRERYLANKEKNKAKNRENSRKFRERNPDYWKNYYQKSNQN